MDFEKLGAFYLGKVFDLEARRRGEALVMYDSKDLVTHAVCVGMTGSGKTGLCVGLLEEAAIDGIPAIVIDPKGDLANLLLTFPELRAEDFRPWVHEEDAARKGQTPDEYAAGQAALWKKGLGEWGQDGARIARLKAAAEFSVYTPGSKAGRAVSIVRSFAAPSEAVREDAEIFRERVATTATSVLGLVGVTGDPVRSREHLLVSALLSRAWSAGEDLDLAALIQQVQRPPVERIGVMDVEAVYPSKERFELAMALNGLLASPGFAAWMEGEALDIGAMLRTKSGTPRVSIFSIAHLNDAERMFFVSLLYSEILAWTRSQSGTTSLRAIVYMDEIAGYFPPTANPPSKAPMLTLMKQARAFGVGMVMATQNPVDLDYKGLSNAGTWFIGRLQTERDKARVLDGLEGAAAGAGSGFDRAAADRALSALGQRVFLMNNVHEDGPVIFETRWCMSYLRGPMTRAELKRLPNGANGTDGANRAEAGRVEKGVGAAGGGRAAAVSGVGAVGARPVLGAEVPQVFWPVRERAPGRPVRYVPRALGVASVAFTDAKAKVDVTRQVVLSAAMVEGVGGVGMGSVDWDGAERVEVDVDEFEREPEAGAEFVAPPGGVTTGKAWSAASKAFADALYRAEKIELFKSASVGEVSRVDESEREFRARLALAFREERDRLTEALRAKYAPKIRVLEDRLRRAEQQVQVQKAQSRDAKLGSVLSAGAAVLGAFLGRKTISAASVTRGASAARSVGRAMRESGDVGRAEETVDAVREQLAELNAQFESDAAEIASRMDPAGETLETITIKPKKTGITVRLVAVAWRGE